MGKILIGNYKGKNNKILEIECPNCKESVFLHQEEALLGFYKICSKCQTKVKIDKKVLMENIAD